MKRRVLASRRFLRKHAHEFLLAVALTLVGLIALFLAGFGLN